MTSDGTTSFSYDAEGNVTASTYGATSSVYDAFNHRVQYNNTQVAFNPIGQRVSMWQATSSTPTLVEAATYWNGQMVSYFDGTGTTFTHYDAFGTKRTETSYKPVFGFFDEWTSTYTSLPFGDGYGGGYGNSGLDGDQNHFGQLDGGSDTAQVAVQAQFRDYYVTAGRWLSPDPYDGSYQFGNPQSLNRYSYVLNSPLGLIDSLGLYTVCDEISYTFPVTVDNGVYNVQTGAIDICSEAGGGGPSSSSSSSGGGSGGPAGGPTGAPKRPTPQNPQAPSKGVLSCAANTASKYSIAGGLHALGIGNNGGIGGFLTNTFGGNTYSGISNLVSTLGSSSSTDQQVLSQMGKAYLRGPLQGIPASLVGASGTPFAAGSTSLVRGAAVGAAFNAVTGANESLVTLSGEVGLSTVGTTAAEFATGVGEAKFALDTVTYLASLAACAAGVAH
jgi:RHS repeat-associated protein